MITIDKNGREIEEVGSNSQASEEIKKRLEYLRGELRAERISYGELAELEDLIPYIEAGDVELLEAAGVPEDHTCYTLEDIDEFCEQCGKKIIKHKNTPYSAL